MRSRLPVLKQTRERIQLKWRNVTNFQGLCISESVDSEKRSAWELVRCFRYRSCGMIEHIMFFDCWQPIWSWTDLVNAAKKYEFTPNRLKIPRAVELTTRSPHTLGLDSKDNARGGNDNSLSMNAAVSPERITANSHFNHRQRYDRLVYQFTDTGTNFGVEECGQFSGTYPFPIVN